MSMVVASDVDNLINVLPMIVPYDPTYKITNQMTLTIVVPN